MHCSHIKHAVMCSNALHHLTCCKHLYLLFDRQCAIVDQCLAVQLDYQPSQWHHSATMTWTVTQHMTQWSKHFPTVHSTQYSHGVCLGCNADTSLSSVLGDSPQLTEIRLGSFSVLELSLAVELSNWPTVCVVQNIWAVWTHTHTHTTLTLTLLIASHLPQQDGLVIGSRNKMAAIRGEVDMNDITCVSLELMNPQTANLQLNEHSDTLEPLLTESTHQTP